ncbi:GUN4 domain-containing protein [Nostoc sp.]|uniref:GUN4 domain-containing protein n=1 Tax=Nostoc sp. TaxID=1180 RepID=UPI002FF46E5E
MQTHDRIIIRNSFKRSAKRDEKFSLHRHTIDNLCLKYSAGRFGFSIQKKIYLSVGSQVDGDF